METFVALAPDFSYYKDILYKAMLWNDGHYTLIERLFCRTPDFELACQDFYPPYIPPIGGKEGG